MILKNKDDRAEDIQELNRLMSLNISSKQRFLIERELKCLMSGNRGHLWGAPMGSGLTFGHLMLNYRHSSQTPPTFSFSRISRYPSR